MKHLLATILISCSAFMLSAQTLYDQFSTIQQTPQIVSFFDGVFNKIGVIAESTGEKLTLEHTGEQIAVSKGLNPDNVEFVLKLNERNVADFLSQSADGEIDKTEATKILRVFFTPMTTATMNHPVLASDEKRKLAGIERIMHVYLLFPDGEIAESHTLLYRNPNWHVIDDIVSEPKRVFWLDVNDAITYQRKMFAAVQADSKKDWRSFLRWYKKWRKDVSIEY